MFALQQVPPITESGEQAGDRRMIDGFLAFVMNQVLLADIRDIGRFGVLGEQVVERLILAGSDALGNRLIPFLGIGEDRIDIEDDAAEIEHPVPHHISNRELRMGNGRRGRRAVDQCMAGCSWHVANLIDVARCTSRRLRIPNNRVRGAAFDRPVRSSAGRKPLRRGARVVDWDGLENRCAFTGTVGSNPTLSAILSDTEAASCLHKRELMLDVHFCALNDIQAIGRVITIALA